MSDDTVLQGDAVAMLRTLPSESVQTCVTSPPYYGLRDYGVAGQIGLEPTLAEYVARLVDVFAEVRRVLRPDGTLWLNLGDSFAAGKAGRTDYGTGDPTSTLGPRGDGLPHNIRPGNVIPRKPSAGLKPKDLCGVPWRVAFALQDAGWWLRSDIIWAKGNAMPESVTDRPSRSHEYVFLLTKRQRYYYDAAAIAEPATNGERFHGGYDKPGVSNHTTARNGRQRGMTDITTRNSRDVWTINPIPFPGAHFATMPPKLVERCILAGSRAGDTVLDPFGGSGTTGMVAQRLERHFTLIELNADYAAMARRRTAQDNLWLATASA